MIGDLTGALAAVSFPEWHVEPDVWVLLGVLLAGYLLVVRSGRSRGDVTERKQVMLFCSGVAVLWFGSDWPVHDLAERYLYSFHMVQHLLFTLVAAPLLLLGTPAWLGRRVLGIGAGRRSEPEPEPGPGPRGAEPGVRVVVAAPTRRLSVVRWLARPVPGLIQFNLVLVLSHWPAVVEATLLHHSLHFVAHAVLLLSALLMWMPVASTIPEVPRARPPTQMLYLFLQTIIPTIPASFLTFGAKPLYRIYETFPRLWGVPALTDQQVAGLIMKIGAGFYLWTVIAVVFFRWYEGEEGGGKAGPEPPAAPAEPDEGVLLWADVERELRQLSGGAAPRVPPKNHY
ncbi:MAG: cytochrome c oxidase assembly protein [Actinomycetota bacterium]|nr:cytochrome c oxidase assembly protein [Actinomycetota bacterium]